MPSIFSHAFFAAVTGKSFFDKSVSVWFWILIAVCAIIPDADVISYSFGVERGTMFSHRGFTHSIFFAILFGTLTAFFARKFLNPKISLIKLIVFFSLATVSHPLLDMLTNGGSGVALLAPFSSQRFFFPWRPIEVSPIGFGFFSERGVTVIFSEIFWIWLPATVIFLTAKIARRFLKK